MHNTVKGRRALGICLVLGALLFRIFGPLPAEGVLSPFRDGALEEAAAAIGGRLGGYEDAAFVFSRD